MLTKQDCERSAKTCRDLAIEANDTVEQRALFRFAQLLERIAVAQNRPSETRY